MSTSLYVRFGLLVLFLSVAVSSNAGSVATVQLTGNVGEQDPLLSNDSPQSVSQPNSIASQINSASSLSAGTPGLPGTKFGGGGLSNGGDLKPINSLPPTPRPTPIPEPGILLDLGMGLAAFVTIWKLKLRRSA